MKNYLSKNKKEAYGSGKTFKCQSMSNVSIIFKKGEKENADAKVSLSYILSSTISFF